MPRPRKGSAGKGKPPVMSTTSQINKLIHEGCVADSPNQLPKLVLETIEKESIFAIHGPDNEGYDLCNHFSPKKHVCLQS